MSLKITSLTIEAGGKRILDDVSLEIGSGEIVALVGPNGSGKSSLAGALMGNYVAMPDEYKFDGGKILLDGESLEEKMVDERSRMGVFCVWQNPTPISGVSANELVLSALRQRGDKRLVRVIRKEIAMRMDELKLEKDLAIRGLNESASGGEKKKMEMVQLAMLDAKYAVFDEIDSGLDVDAVKTIAKQMNDLAKRGIGVMVVSHSSRLLELLDVNKVILMKQGRIEVVGGKKMIKEIEEKGYE